MKIKVAIITSILLIVGFFVWAETSSKEKFSLAKDFPNGALVYLQITDLPQFIKLWNESKLKEKYLNSENFSGLQKRHLGIKIAERWNDWSNAVGFSLDLQTLGSLGEKQAAVAIYDVGKLDIVFVAPMNETVFSATMFAQNSGDFEEISLDDKTTAYVIDAEVERQKQKQKVIFANIKGRFVLATNEKLFLQTVSQITGKQKKQSLYDEPNFKKMSERITPNLATIWLDQERLNSDYYFKRYWLMSDVEDLQNIQAGIFDISLGETGLTEKREFLLKESQNLGQISNAEAQDLTRNIPENVPYFHLQKVEEKQLGEAIYETILDKKEVKNLRRSPSRNWSYEDYSYDDNSYEYENYHYLNSDFDEEINQIDEDENIEEKPFQTNQFVSALGSANPTIILTATSPKILESPMFVEFRKVAIVSLKNPNNFQSNHFENTIVKALKHRITVADAKFEWTTENEFRKLNIPMLGWEIGYQLNGSKLFVSNSFEFLQECLANENKREISANGMSQLTVINLTNRKEHFDNVMKILSNENGNFFTGNLASMLDVFADVKQIEVRRKSEDNFLQEEILAK
ncbi:MAG: hypothetical protein AAB336_03605 [Acidobacteriota bacterium]